MFQVRVHTTHGTTLSRKMAHYSQLASRRATEKSIYSRILQAPAPMETRQQSSFVPNLQAGGKHKTSYFKTNSHYLTRFVHMNRIGTEKRPEKQHFVPPTPGPGSYNCTQTDMGKNGPKYSTVKRPINPVKDSPGPGAY